MVSYNCALDMSLPPWLSPSPRRARGLASLPWIRGARVDTEFVVAAPNVLRERVTSHDQAGCVVALESPHRPEPRFEAPVVGFDPIVRVLVDVMERAHIRH
jgi:hypothetical protein